MKFLLHSGECKIYPFQPGHLQPARLRHPEGAGAEEHMELAEYTINQPFREILADIYGRKPDCIAFPAISRTGK